MTREEKIEKECIKLQKSIDNLKLLNCSLDLRYNTFAIFDNTIEPDSNGTDWAGDKDHANQIVYSIDTSFHIKVSLSKKH